jgi:hypothetical protein
MGQRFRFAALATGESCLDRLTVTHANTCHADETAGVIDQGLRDRLGSTGTIAVQFRMVTNLRPKVMQHRLPQLQEFEKISEKALKGSSISH